MKNFLKLFALFACFATLFAACNSDETVDDYTPEVKSFETYDMVAGSEKIYVTWTVPNDESITGTKISWSGSTSGSHSISDLTANDQKEFTITDLKAGGTYTVTIENLVGGYVGTGSVFVSGLAVYGPSTYAKEALPTMVGTATHDGTDATVSWKTGGSSKNAGVDVTYTDSDGLTASAIALYDANGDATTTLIKAQEGTYFTCAALFMPDGGYDYAEVEVEGDNFFIASTELTAAAPEISNTMGGLDKVQFSWSVTSEVTKSVIQLYTVSVDGNTASGSAIELSGDALSDIVSSNVATYVASSLTAGESYKVEVTNYIDINSVSTATLAVMSESTMFVYNNDTYVAPAITSVINDRGIVSISWDMSGDKVIASDLLRIEFSYQDDDDATQVAIYDTYDTSLVLTAAKSNTFFTAKAYFMPSNSIEGTENEIEKVISVDTDGANQGEIPAPILYAPQSLTLSPGFDGTESYVMVSWDALTELDLEEATAIKIYYKQDNRDDLTETGTAISVDKSLSEYKLTGLEGNNAIYFVVLATVNGDGYETVGDFWYFATYNQETYASNVLNATSIVRSGDSNVDATITWDWSNATDVAVGVEITEYIGVDGLSYTVAKTKRDDATTTTLANVKGGTEVKYSAYYCPQGGLDSLAVAQTAITVPYLVVADAPTFTLLAGVGENAPYIQVSWDSFDYTNIASATLYCANAEGGDAIVVAVPDVTTGVATIENLTLGVEYTVYMTLTDNDGVEHTPETPVVVAAPTLYDVDTYKEAASVTILSENGATYDGEELTINLDLSGVSEELVGIVASYTTTDDVAATAGNSDYVAAGESIPSTLVMSGIKASSDYVITPYYRPSTGVTPVAGGNTITLTVPAIAPTVAVVTGVVSSYNKSGNGSESEITVSWTLEDNVARVAIQNSKMYVMMVADDTVAAAAEVSVESGVESYSTTINTTTNGVVADKVYTIYIETRDTDSVPYVSNSVAGVKSYNQSTYSTASLPAFIAEYDKYSNSAVVGWDAESLNADITTMSVTYNSQTESVDMTSGSQSFTYSSLATTATLSATFLPVATESTDDAVTATYGETVDVTSAALTLVEMYYDIVYSSNVYQIYTGEGLVAFAAIVNGTYAESAPSIKTNITDWTQNVAATGSVVGNVDLDGYTWTPIADYRGTFDGGSNSGYSISNLTVSATTTYQGLFASTIGATISNITLKSVNLVSTANYAGAIAGTVTEKTTVTNCIVESGIVSGAVYTGGLIGYNAASTVENCRNGAAVTGTGNTGGIVGLNRDEDVANSTVNNCYNSGSVTSTGSINGGIVGSNYASGETYAVIVSNCTNDGNVTGSSGQTAGIVGCHRGNTSVTGGVTVSNAAVDGVLFSAVIQDCVNNGDVTDTTSGNVGGIAGYFLNNNIATRSTNNGKIIGASNTAGIVGQNRTNGYYGYVTYCDNYGAVESGTTVGGIVGYNYGVLSVISYCNNYGSITVPSTYTSTNANAGGIVGNNTNAVSSAINYCNNEGDITSGVGANTGGIVGLAGGANLSILGNSSSYNYNSGTVSGITNVGGLVGSHAAVISYYTNKGEVFVSGVSSSVTYGLVGTGSGTITDCTNYFESSAAEAVSSVAAYPTYTIDSDGVDTSIIEVSWSFGEVTALTNATKVNVYYKSSSADSYSVETIAVSTSSMTTTATLGVDADEVYSVYVTTETADGVETSSDVLSSSPLEIEAYNSSSYDNKIPVAASVTNDGTTVTINWDADSIDSDLTGIILTYGSESISCAKADLASATTLTYNSDAQTFSYISSFKPVAYADNDAVLGVTTSATYVDLPSQPAEAVSDVAAYPSFVVGEDSETSIINVSWAYGETTTNIASVVVYYKKSTESEYASVILTGTSLTSYTLGAENETIDADATYNVYVTTRNSDNTDTAITGDVLEVKAYNSSSYDSSMPAVASVINNGTNVIITWDAESISSDLSKVSIAYGASVFEFTTFTEAATFAYDAQYETFSYTATFKPAAYASNESVVSVDVSLERPVVIPAEAAEAVTVADVYPSYTTEGDVDDSNITVEWSYDNGSSYISAVNIYYKESGAERYSIETISESVATTLTKTLTGLVADKDYDVYVSTVNESGAETLSNYSSVLPAAVKTYNSGSYGVALVPGVSATHNGTDITPAWTNTDAEDLISVAVLYNDNTITILKENLATTTIAYVSGADTFTYSATFRPTDKSAEVIVAAESEVAVVLTGTDIVLNGDVYEIYTADGLVAFAGLVNGTAATTTPSVATNVTDWTQNLAASAKLMDSFSLSAICGAEVGEGTTWTPIAASSAYTGTFDGNDMTISDLYIYTEDTYQGLFGRLGAGTIKNLTLANVDATTNSAAAQKYFAALVGYASGGTISSCKISSGEVKSINSAGAAYIGTFAAYFGGGGTISDSENYANITSASQQVGGLIGGSTGGYAATIERCKNYGNVTVSGGGYAGGIVAYAFTTSGYIVIEDCENYGKVSVNTTTGYTGGFAGIVRANGAGSVTLSGCVNNGEVYSDGPNVGGIAGFLNPSNASGYIYVTDCENKASVTAGTNNAGGIVGNDSNATGGFQMKNSNNSGAVSGAANVGGIIGYLNTGHTIEGTSSSYGINSGSVTGTAEATVGGLVGCNLGTISYYTNTGEVIPTQQLVGTSSTGTTEESCADEYVEVEPAAAAEAVTVTAPTAEGTTITVAWAYGEAKDNISKVVVYYSADGTTYTSKEVEGNTDTSVTLTSEEGIVAGTTYKVYVVTANSESVETAATDGGTSTSPLSVEVPAEPVSDIVLADGTYEIYTAAGLEAFAGIVNGSYSETTPEVTSEGIESWAQNASANAVVKANITLEDAWTPMASYGGTFDGGNGLTVDNYDAEADASVYTISGLSVDATTTYQGLFASTVEGATIKNVTLVSPSIESTTSYVGGISAAVTGSTVSFCKIEGGAITSGATNVGGVVGNNLYSTVEYCTNSAEVTGKVYSSTASGSGGIVGYVQAASGSPTADFYVRNCVNRGSVVGGNGTTDASCTAGIIGNIYTADATYVCYVSDCVNYGSVSAAAHSGGVIGYSRGAASANIVIQDCANYGNVTNSGNNPGGIVGYFLIGSVLRCSNYGDITGDGSTNVGGIVGQAAAVTTISGEEGNLSYNYGKVSGTSVVGGLVGKSSGTLTYYGNTGSVWTNGVLSNGGDTAKLTGSGTAGDGCVDEYTGDGTELE